MQYNEELIQSGPKLLWKKILYGTKGTPDSPDCRALDSKVEVSGGLQFKPDEGDLGVGIRSLACPILGLTGASQSDCRDYSDFAGYHDMDLKTSDCNSLLCSIAIVIQKSNCKGGIRFK